MIAVEAEMNPRIESCLIVVLAIAETLTSALLVPSIGPRKSGNGFPRDLVCWAVTLTAFGLALPFAETAVNVAVDLSKIPISTSAS